MPEFLDPLGIRRPGRPYSPIVKSGDLVFVSGTTRMDYRTGKLVDGGVRVQTKQALANILALLATQGLSAEQIVKTTVFLKRIEDFAEMNSAYAEIFGNKLPARSTVGVHALPSPEALLEIEAIASAK
jgi:2-iminobutanoate/2-iminopropanoate deaminase